MESDIPQLAGLIRKLAEYENLLDSYTATEELYRIHGFGGDAIFRALLVENQGEHGPDHLGMALYYFTFSTFTGKPTLYLEDIFVLEEYRGHGIRTRLLVELAKIAREKESGRMEWSMPDGTIRPSNSIFPSEPGPWTSGPSTASPHPRSRNWRKEE